LIGIPVFILDHASDLSPVPVALAEEDAFAGILARS